MLQPSLCRYRTASPRFGSVGRFRRRSCLKFGKSFVDGNVESRLWPAVNSWRPWIQARQFQKQPSLSENRGPVYPREASCRPSSTRRIARELRAKQKGFDLNNIGGQPALPPARRIRIGSRPGPVGPRPQPRILSALRKKQQAYPLIPASARRAAFHTVRLFSRLSAESTIQPPPANPRPLASRVLDWN